eukprot:TRINITY_DN10096_c0_g1_i2.p1 TRINITY_DN10096_c0_g1~~TRINITY_DN10096_c0_g1_i2.p1  ORF type:complete len:636 (+),score=181.45 TRINITY_DN10096_c0_g1_i2:111-2018(+)
MALLSLYAVCAAVDVCAADTLQDGIAMLRRAEEQRSEELMRAAFSALTSAAESCRESTGKAMFYAGVAASALGDSAAAVEAYETSAAWHLETGLATPLSVYENLAVAHTSAGRHLTASVYARRWAAAAKTDPQRAAAMVALGSALLWAGDTDGGDDAYAAAVALLRGSDSLARVYFEWAQERELFGHVPAEGWLSCNATLPLPDVADRLTRLDPSECSSPASWLRRCTSGGGGGHGHYERYVRPMFDKAMKAALQSWPGCSGGGGLVDPETLPSAEVLDAGGERYGWELPLLHRSDGYTYPTQRYVSRRTFVVRVRDAVLCGNEAAITLPGGCSALAQSYGRHLPYHENLCRAGGSARRAVEGQAVSIAVPFPANYYSFVVDALPRLLLALSEAPGAAVLVPTDGGQMKPFMRHALTRMLRVPDSRLIPYPILPPSNRKRLASARVRVGELVHVDWARAGDPRNDSFLLPPPFALRRARAVMQALAEPCAGQWPSGRYLLWIARTAASSRRVANERRVLRQLSAALAAQKWHLRVFGDSPPPDLGCAVKLFQGAGIVAGMHGSGMANLLFASPGAVVVEIGLPEPHSQYAAHLSAALGLRYTLLPLSGRGLHQRLYVTIPEAELVELAGRLAAAL